MGGNTALFPVLLPELCIMVGKAEGKLVVSGKPNLFLLEVINLTYSRPVGVRKLNGVNLECGSQKGEVAAVLWHTSAVTLT